MNVKSIAAFWWAVIGELKYRSILASLGVDPRGWFREGDRVRFGHEDDPLGLSAQVSRPSCLWRCFGQFGGYHKDCPGRWPIEDDHEGITRCLSKVTHCGWKWVSEHGNSWYKPTKMTHYAVGKCDLWGLDTSWGSSVNLSTWLCEVTYQGDLSGSPRRCIDGMTSGSGPIRMSLIISPHIAAKRHVIV